MGMYCCCDEKITDGYKCKCKWEGWVDLRKNRVMPERDGIYKVRAITDSGDCYEGLMKYQTTPFRIETPSPNYGGKDVPIHWENCHWDGDIVYAWKPIATEPPNAATT